MSYPLRILNKSGIRMGQDEIALKTEPQLFLNWINLPEYSTKAEFDVSLDKDFSFDNKLELAKYLHQQLGEIPDKYREDPGLWTWICFLYLDKLVERKNGLPNYYAAPNYILTHRGHKSSLAYRHRVYAWYGLYEKHGDEAKFFLSSGEPYQQGAVIENIASRFWINDGHFDLIYDLYFDEEKQRIRKNFDEKPPQISDKKVGGKYKGEGQMRRLIKVLRQLDTVVILKKMNLSQKKEYIGPEFND